MSFDKDLLILLFLFIGISYLILGVILLVYEKNKRKNAKSEIIGKIVDYYYSNNIIIPIAEYKVGEKIYRQKRRFRAIISIKSFLTLKDLEIESHVALDHEDILHIHGGAVRNYKYYLKKMYPLGSKVKIFYNPVNPKQSYVEKVPTYFYDLSIIALGIGILILTITFIAYLN